MIARRIRTRSQRSLTASSAKQRVTSQRTATSGMKNPVHIVDDSTTSPTTAGTKTNQNRTRPKGRQICANIPGMRKLTLQIVTHSTQW